MKLITESEFIKDLANQKARDFCNAQELKVIDVSTKINGNYAVTTVYAEPKNLKWGKIHFHII